MEELQIESQTLSQKEKPTCGRCGEYYNDCECPWGPLKD